MDVDYSVTCLVFGDQVVLSDWDKMYSSITQHHAQSGIRTHNLVAVTYIRVTGNFIFQPYRYVVACVT